MRTRNSDRVSGQRNIAALIAAAAIMAGFPDSSWANTECSGTVSFPGADNAETFTLILDTASGKCVTSAKHLRQMGLR
jgi:hypothetical protein